MRRITGNLALLVWLTGVWVALWGSLSVANVLGGLLLACVLLLALPLPELPRSGRVRPVALVRLIVVFLLELVKASVTVLVQVVDPRKQLRQAVVAVPVLGISDRLLTLLANSVSLTPGTLALEVDRPGSTLYVHVLDLGGADGGVEDVRRSIGRMERLIVEALGPQEALDDRRTRAVTTHKEAR